MDHSKLLSLQTHMKSISDYESTLASFTRSLRSSAAALENQLEATLQAELFAEWFLDALHAGERIHFPTINDGLSSPVSQQSSSTSSALQFITKPFGYNDEMEVQKLITFFRSRPDILGYILAKWSTKIPLKTKDKNASSSPNHNTPQECSDIVAAGLSKHKALTRFVDFIMKDVLAYSLVSGDEDTLTNSSSLAANIPSFSGSSSNGSTNSSSSFAAPAPETFNINQQIPLPDFPSSRLPALVQFITSYFLTRASIVEDALPRIQSSTQTSDDAPVKYDLDPEFRLTSQLFSHETRFTRSGVSAQFPSRTPPSQQENLYAGSQCDDASFESHTVIGTHIILTFLRRTMAAPARDIIESFVSELQRMELLDLYPNVRLAIDPQADYAGNLATFDPLLGGLGLKNLQILMEIVPLFVNKMIATQPGALPHELQQLISLMEDIDNDFSTRRAELSQQKDGEHDAKIDTVVKKYVFSFILSIYNFLPNVKSL